MSCRLFPLATKSPAQNQGHRAGANPYERGQHGPDWRHERNTESQGQHIDCLLLLVFHISFFHAFLFHAISSHALLLHDLLFHVLLFHVLFFHALFFHHPSLPVKTIPDRRSGIRLQLFLAFHHADGSGRHGLHLKLARISGHRGDEGTGIC